MEGSLIPTSSMPLAELCELIGITTADLAAVEGVEALAHTFAVGSGDAARLNSAHAQAFTDHYGDAASLEIRTGDLTEIVIAPGVSDSDLAAFSARAPSGGPYEAVVRVDKTRLAERIVGPSSPRPLRVFLFAESLRRLLARGITRFEAEAWPDAPAPLVVAVLDTDINLIGPHLTVLGGVSLAAASAAAATVSSAVDFDAIWATRDRHIGWDTPWVRALTPWHFDVAGTCADPELRGLLRAQLVKLAVLFTCDRARTRPTATRPGEVLAEYRGREHVAVVPIDERVTVDATDHETAAIMRAVDWCYQRHGAMGQPDWVSDRLPFVQTRVAQALEPHPANDRLSALTRAMPYLIEGIEWHWKAFIEGKVGEYLDRVQQVETVVTETVTKFADRTAELVKSITDTMLAAVAVLIGSFIAAAFSAPFNATLFRIGVLTYAGYVLLFPGVVGLVASMGNMRAARIEFDTRVQRFNETLYPDKVTEIVGERLESAQRTFYRWLVFAAVVYAGVAVAAGVAAAKVPGVIRSDLAVHEPAPATTTTSPSPTS